MTASSPGVPAPWEVLFSCPRLPGSLLHLKLTVWGSGRSLPVTSALPDSVQAAPPTLCAEQTGPGGLWGRLDPHSPFSPVTFRGPFCPRCRAERIADLISFLNGLIFLSKDIETNV